ncbi:MAG TPA: hypothetical protein VJH68_00365 [Candidatus Nanoarchaeia archaeon]|nr:hypothetical protein [Candidatus Nanoarchaeia archaeon]
MKNNNKDYIASEKPSLDELILAIDDVYSIDQQRREADWSSLRYKKDFLLEKCSIIRRVLSAYLGDALTLKGYLDTVDYLENDFKKL